MGAGLSGPARAFAAYDRLLTRRPLLGNCATAGVLGFGGDVICQRYVEGAPSTDWRRCWTLTSFCAAYHGACCYYIYSTYDHVLPKAALSTLLRTGVSKALLDTCVHLPFLYVPAFYVYVGLLQQQQDLSGAIATLRQEWFETTTGCFVFWGPFDVMMFSVVPVHWRIPFMCSGCLVWNVYLSSCSMAGAPKEPSKDTP
mmetsp:Transcript_2157/g.4801  ORF Transcript_2157/g.4801 Transcript_2157/m.4801 type:complete len:199 (+) Transcript_2157:69-665(+)